MKKKFGLGLLITCLLLLVSGFCMESYAYTFDDFINMCNQVANSGLPNSYIRTANRILTNETKVKNVIGSNNYISYIARVDASGNIEIYLFSDRRSFTTTNANPPYISYSGRPSAKITIDNGNWVGIEYNTWGQTSFTYNGTNPAFGLVESSTEITNWYNLIFNNYYEPPVYFDFSPGSSTIVKVGNYDHVYLINYWPTTPIVWGIVNNYNDLLSPDFSYSLGIMTPDGNDEILFNYIDEEFMYLSHYYWQTPARKIYMNRVYKLFVNYDDQEYVYVYYIAPYGTNYTSGETIGYFYNSGDSAFDTQVATNTIIDSMTDTQQVDMTLDNITSGDIYNKLGYTEYHTTWNNFMYDMFIGIENAMFSSGDIAFTFPYMRTTLTLHSSDFTTPPGILKGFCSSFLMFGFIVLVYQHIARFYHRLQEGAVNQVVEEFNVDDETLIL